MTDRTVSVKLGLDVRTYVAGMERAKRSTSAFVRDARGEFARASRESRADLDRIGTAVAAMGVAGAVGLGRIAAAAAQFDQEMSGVAAVAGATAGELDALRQAAIRAGADTAFSAGQSARAISELTRAGVAVGDVLGGALTGSLDLAAAGNLELADAATIAAQTLRIFDLQGDETVRVADALAAGANRSAADVGTLGEALRQGGLVASQYGLGLETTVGTLALFADNALVGSDAGTSFKVLLQRLVPQSDEAARAMEAIGFTAFDAQGSFVGLESVADQLRNGLSGLSDQQRASALNTIFGSDAVRAASVLYDSGADGVRDYTEAVSEQGAAAAMAATMLDNLAGDVEEFTGSVETAAIDWGENLDGILRATVQGGTAVVNVLGAIPEPVQDVALGLGAVATAAGLAGGSFLLAAPRLLEVRRTVGRLAEELPRTTAAMGKLRSPAAMAGVTLAGVALVDVLGDVLAYQNRVRASADELTDAYLDLSRSAVIDTSYLVRDRLQSEGLLGTLSALGLTIDDVTRAVHGGAAGVDELAESFRYSGDVIRVMRNNLSVLPFIDVRDDTTRLRDVLDEMGRSADVAGDQMQASAEEAAAGARLFSSHQQALNFYLSEGYDYSAAFAAASIEMAQANDVAAGSTQTIADRIERAGEAAGRAVTPYQLVRGELAGIGTTSDTAATATDGWTNRLLAAETAARRLGDGVDALGDAQQDPIGLFSRTPVSLEVELELLMEADPTPDPWADYEAEVAA